MLDLITRPWPWYVGGTLLGLVGVALLFVGNRMLGVSGSYRTICAAVAPRSIEFFRFDWRRSGAWNLAFAAGLVLGGLLAVTVLGSPQPAAISASATADLAALGVRDFTGLVPADLFSWEAALTLRGLFVLVLGGFLVGFGASYAGGCTSGHGIMGLADFQLPSLVAVCGFFVGGLISAHFVLPFFLSGGTAP